MSKSEVLRRKLLTTIGEMVTFALLNCGKQAMFRDVATKIGDWVLGVSIDFGHVVLWIFRLL